MIPKALLFAWLACAAGPLPEAPTQRNFAVIVNTSNAFADTNTAKATVKKLFLKDLTQWRDGTEARPYARQASTAEHTAFLKGVLNMSEAELARHWLKVKNMNGTTPPKEVDSDRMLIKHVAKHQGALGVVSIQAAKEATGIKVLFEF